MHQLDNGGYEALLHFLLNLTIDVDLRAIPRTPALLEQQLATFSPVESWLWEILRSAELPGDMEGEGLSPNEQLYASYLQHSKNIGRTSRSIQTTVGIFLNSHLQTRNIRRPNDDGKPTRYTSFPPLSTCRKLFAAKVGIEGIRWPQPGAWQARDGQTVESRRAF
jgi:hypothetical protein